MKFIDKTRAQLMRELAGTRQQPTNLDALEESEEKYRTLFQESRDAIFITTLDGKLTDANQSYLDLFGYATEEALGLDVRKTYANPDDRLRFQQEIEQKGAVRDYELKLQKKDGTELDCLLTATVRRSKDGVILGYHGFIRDITARRRMEKELQESNRRFRDITENALEWIWETNADGKYTYASPLVEKILGYEPEEVLEKHFYDLFHPDDREELKKAAFEVFAKKQPFREFVNRNIHKNGEIVWLSTSGVPMLDEEGSLLGYRGADIDITDRKRAEMALKESEEKYRSLVQNIDVGICRVTPGDKGRYIEVNPAVSRISGYSREELLRMNVSDMYQDPSDRKKFADKVCTQGSVKNEELKLRRKDGTPIVVSDTAIAIYDEKGNIIYIDAILEDITQRKQAEEALVDEATRRHILVEQSKDGIVILDQNGKVYEANQQFAEMLGYSPEETAQLHVWDWDTQWTREQLLEMIQSIDAAGDHFQTYHRRKDGTVYDVEISTNGAIIAGQKLVFCVCRDITDRKQTEEKLQKLYQVEKEAHEELEREKGAETAIY